MFRKPNPASSVPIYTQIEEQIQHAIETGALVSGDQLPSIRSMAEKLVINANTVIRVYRDLEAAGAIEVRHGLGAFVAGSSRARRHTEQFQSAQKLVRSFLEKLHALGLQDDEVRRLVEAEIMESQVPGRR